MTTTSPTTSAARRAYENLTRPRLAARHPPGRATWCPNHVGIDSRWVIEHPDWFISLPDAAVPRLHASAARTSRRIGRVGDPHRGPLLRQHRRRRRLQAHRPRDRRGPLHLPRQRRHQHAVERHRAARLPARRRSARRSSRRSSHVARQFPVIRFDAAMTLAKRHIQRLWYPEPGHGGAHPVARRARDDPGRVRRGDARRVLARGRRPRRRGGARHAAARRGVLDDGGLLRPDARHAPRLQQRVHEHAAATRRTSKYRAVDARTSSSSIPRSSSASSTS